ncbi:response regulator [Shewanella gaetbuli]|uniref:Response regulator n=1 Tax=Shewanella gaetbuli TaxID=220752 RepID=A0A9X1ZHJ8_9GAMM|nr:response regulator [Shewanella gaetbuli]MCL1141656.1 response regulator [Shewanella gaetbuli]
MTLTGKSILFVEDDPIFSQLVTDFLEKRGAKVEHSVDGRQGLVQFNEKSFDIVIADLNMPKLGGLPMIRQMMAINPNVPAIVISGNDVMSDVIEALRIGASDYLVKPITDLYIIESAIMQALSQAKLNQSNLTLDQTPLDADDMLAQQLAELSYQELNENLAMLEQSAQAAKNVQQQLFPASHIQYPRASIDYSLYKNSDVSAYFIDSTMVGDDHLVMYMAHFQPEDNSAAFACVLLRSFIDQKLKKFRSNADKELISPTNMLGYLHERMQGSGLHIFTNMAYISVNLSSYEATIARAGTGLKCYLRNANGLLPIALPDCQPIGSVLWSKPSVQTRQLSAGEYLCVGTHFNDHQQALLNNHFTGLIFNESTHAGGFMQLDFG